METPYIYNIMFSIGFLILGFYYKFAYMKIPLLDVIFFPNLDNKELFLQADHYASSICLIFSITELCGLLLLFIDKYLSIRFSGILFFGGALSVIVLRKRYIFKRMTPLK